MIEKFIIKSPFHDKFGMDSTIAVQEAQELFELKMSHSE